MDTRSAFPDSSISGRKQCVYCGGEGETDDHAPPRSLLAPPLPSNLLTVPACKACNTGFSFDEQVVKTLIALIGTHAVLVAERQSDGRIGRALARDRRLRSIFERAKDASGNYELDGELLASFDRVMKKTVQGLFFGLYERFVAPEQLRVIRISDQRLALTAEQLVDEVRPSPLRDISDEPLPDLTPDSWPLRDPIFFMDMISLHDGQPLRRAFRLIRETPVQWVSFQPDVFQFGFVQSEDGKAVCVLDLWKTLAVAVTAPWPDKRGPLRRGRKNPLSRERRSK